MCQMLLSPRREDVQAKRSLQFNVLSKTNMQGLLRYNAFTVHMCIYLVFPCEVFLLMWHWCTFAGKQIEQSMHTLLLYHSNLSVLGALLLACWKTTLVAKYENM